MTINLDPIYINDSQLFKVNVYDADGITPVTPLSCTGTVYNADTNAQIVTGAGAVGAGYAQYNWAGTGTPALYEAVLTVTISAGVIQTEHFRVEVRDKPPEFTNDISTDIGVVRLELGDDEEGDGVRPNGKNFTDAQIRYAIDEEGELMRAVAKLCEVLARQWARVADISVGSRSESFGDIAEKYKTRAEELRTVYGGGSSQAFSVSLARSDGYSGNDGLSSSDSTEFTVFE
jgi:hypothetical protein